MSIEVKTLFSGSEDEFYEYQIKVSCHGVEYALNVFRFKKHKFVEHLVDEGYWRQLTEFGVTRGDNFPEALVYSINGMAVRICEGSDCYLLFSYGEVSRGEFQINYHGCIRKIH